jgi:hypothetical protein
VSTAMVVVDATVVDAAVVVDDAAVVVDDAAVVVAGAIVVVAKEVELARMVVAGCLVEVTDAIDVGDDDTASVSPLSELLRVTPKITATAPTNARTANTPVTTPR